MYHRLGLGQCDDLGQDIMDRPEVSGVYDEFGYGYGGEHGLGISLKGIVRGIGRGVTAPFRKVIKPVAKRAFKIGKGVARVGFKAVKIAAPFALPAVGGILVAKKGIPLLARLFGRKKAAPAEEPVYTTMPVRLSQQQMACEASGGQWTRSGCRLPNGKKLPTTPVMFEQPILRAEEPDRPSIQQIGREVLERVTAGTAPGAGPAGVLPSPAAGPAESGEVETVTRPTMAGLMGGPMPLLLLAGAAVAMLAGAKKGGGRGRRRRR